MLKIFKDLLQTKVDGNIKFSQGRVYLFIFILSYLGLLGFLVFRMITPLFSIDIATVATIVDALQWAIMLFAAYVFGGKGIQAVQAVMQRKSFVPPIVNPTTATPPPVTPVAPAQTPAQEDGTENGGV